jgi:hypothetical protein
LNIRPVSLGVKEHLSRGERPTGLQERRFVACEPVKNRMSRLTALMSFHRARRLAIVPRQRHRASRFDQRTARDDVPRAEDYLGAATKRPSTLSCVLSITDAHGRRALLTGDLEAEQELRLARDAPATLRADVLLVPHHGSSTSSTPALLDVVARYAERGIALHDTVHCGAWRATSDSPAARCERDDRRRYWHHGLEVARSAGTVEERETLWRSMSR